MGRKKPVAEEDLLIPPQDNKICGTICVCQMTLVLSCVAIVYLTVAIYVPANNIFNAGVELDPVMCITTRSAQKEMCNWTSCSEWCLSKGTGACLQIYVNLRHNGSSVTFNNCTNSVNKTCYSEVNKNYTCIKEECKNLTGLFNCTKGVCDSISESFLCEYVNLDPITKCSGRRGKVTCMEIHGLFTCDRGACQKIRPPYNCDRRCNDIPINNKNIILLQGDNVFLSKCVYAQNSTTKDEIWNDSENNVLMASCHQISQNLNNGTVEAHDCVNGSVLMNKALLNEGANNSMVNFTYLTYLHLVEAEINRSIAPFDADLTIQQEAGLKINFEGCVNTLRDECRLFLNDYGKDGSDHNARARFPCYYSPIDTYHAYQSFDLEKEYRQFMIGFLVPTVLLVVSCFTLILCQKSVVVGDDSKMRFKCLTNEDTGKLKSSGANSRGDGDAL